VLALYLVRADVVQLDGGVVGAGAERGALREKLKEKEIRKIKTLFADVFGTTSLRQQGFFYSFYSF